MEKKLNLRAPLLSTRRYSSPLRSSGEDNRRDSPAESRDLVVSQQSDMNLGEVVKPGSVPFMWEQAPGKAKDGIESQLTSPVELPSTPNHPPSMPFPPGRRSGELNGFRAPNKLSGELVVLRQRNKLSGELNVVRPQNRFSGELNSLKSHKLSGELNTLRHNSKFSGELSSLHKYAAFKNDSMVRWDSSKEGTEMNASSESELDDEGTFSDAVDTFSQRGSFSVNCSTSGLSGSERPDSKPSELISADPKARDFMMNRFLPAAKAMTLEPSQYASRKQIVAVEQPKEVKALIPRPNTPPRANNNVCHIVPYTGQDIGSEESEDEESGFDKRSIISIQVKACGFLPWLCSKNSLRLMNPLPAMKLRSRSALSSASKVGNMIKSKTWRSPSQKQPKDSLSNHRNRVAPIFKSCELQKPTHANRPMFYSGELQTRSGSPYRSSRRSNVSPYMNGSPPPSYQKGSGLIAAPKPVDPYEHTKSSVALKGSKIFEDPKRNRRSGTRTPVAEKTLYIDSVNIPKVSHSILNVSSTKRQTDAISKSGPLYDVLRSRDSLQRGGRMEIMKARGMSGPLVCGGAYADAPFSQNVNAKPSRVSVNGNTNSCRDLVLVEDDSVMQSSLTPPLPKSPTESWLSRQIPSVSPRVSPRNSVCHSSLNSKFVSRKQNVKSPTSGAKWETIVKSSHLRADHGRYSEELVTRAPQPPRKWN